MLTNILLGFVLLFLIFIVMLLESLKEAPKRAEMALDRLDEIRADMERLARRLSGEIRVQDAGEERPLERAAEPPRPGAPEARPRDPYTPRQQR
jgi:hypothetical protein